MIDFLISNLWLFWAVVAFVCLILEMSSGDFYVTCFAVGAIGGVLVSLLGMPFWAQVVVWAVCSILSILFIRPRLLRWTAKHGEHRESNADAIIGRTGEVTETIKAHDFGRVKLDGDDWKAQSNADLDIAKGSKVKIIGRESVILTVEKL